jgi:hypothetical protein
VLFGSGCAANLGVPSFQLMEEPLAQSRSYAAGPDALWDSVAAFGREDQDCGMLVESRSDHLVSWCKRATGWRDLGQDAIAAKARDGSPEPFAKFAQSPGAGISVTTVLIIGSLDTSAVEVRRVYYGKDSLPGVAHSRGDAEKALYTALERQHPPLTANVDVGEGGAR